MSGDLISREELEKALFMVGRMYVGGLADENMYLHEQRVYEVLRSIPAVEAEPVVRAHWEFLNDYQSRCSRCHSEVFMDHNDEPPYCERCGAHMDEEVPE